MSFFARHKWDILLSFLLSALYILLFSTSTSPLFAGEWESEHLDSSIFQMMGVAILNGKIPYLDLFDHKGCILFFINALGYLICGKTGVLLLQIINLAMTLIIWKQTISCLVKKQWQHWLCILLTLWLMTFSFEEGNLSEEWSLPWISLPFFYYFRYLYQRREKLPLSRLFIIGIATGIIASIRINNAAMIFGLLLYLLFLYAIQRQWKYILLAISTTISGFLLPIIVSCIWFYASAGIAGLDWLWFGTIGFNLEYIKQANLAEGATDFWVLMKMSSLLILPCLALRHSNGKMLPLLIGFLLTALITGKVIYYHYLTIYAPLVVIIFASMLQNRWKTITMSGVMILLLPDIGSKTWNICSHALEDPAPYLSFKQEFKDIICSIPKGERDSIWNYNTTQITTDCMNDLRLTQSNQLVLRKHIHISERMSLQKFFMQEKSPKWILVADTPYIRQYDQEFFNTHYSRFAATQKGLVNVIVYRRNE